jgi:hypothetical protein
MDPNPLPPKVILGDLNGEMRAIQILALALNKGATWAATSISALALKQTIPPLLLGAAKAVSFASVGGLDTPVEIFALAARNTFELFLRIKHVIQSDQNCQAWREEAPRDQLQVYEGILKLNPPQSMRNVFEAEMERVRQHATSRGLKPRSFMTTRKLAEATKLEGEYDAFYKVYSKFIHPSSFVINWPAAASTPMHRDAFIFNLQIYGYRILETVQDSHGLPLPKIVAEAGQQLDAALRSS